MLYIKRWFRYLEMEITLLYFHIQELIFALPESELSNVASYVISKLRNLILLSVTVPQQIILLS